MKYIARVAVDLENYTLTNGESKWHHIKTVSDIEYRWKLKEGLMYEVVAGVFDDKYIALKCAKEIYVTLLYKFLKECLL